MLVPKANRLAVYSHLFKEGVLVAHKDYVKPKHDEIDVPNLQVIKLMTSLKSRGYVRESFAWMWFYWYLTDEGIEYLRDYLHLPAEIIPATLKKLTRPARGGPAPTGGRFGKDQQGGDRPSFKREGNYRKEGGFGRGGGQAGM